MLEKWVVVFWKQLISWAKWSVILGDNVIFENETTEFILFSLRRYSWWIRYAVCSWFSHSLSAPKQQVTVVGTHCAALHPIFLWFQVFSCNVIEQQSFNTTLRENLSCFLFSLYALRCLFIGIQKMPNFRGTALCHQIRLRTGSNLSGMLSVSHVMRRWCYESAAVTKLPEQSSRHVCLNVTQTSLSVLITSLKCSCQNVLYSVSSRNPLHHPFAVWVLIAHYNDIVLESCSLR